MNADYKKCPDCLEILPLEAFPRRGDQVRCVDTYCRTCDNKRKRESHRRCRAGLGRPPVEYTKLQAIEGLLQDGQWHTTTEVREVGGVSYSSRVSILRQRGLQIAKKRDYGSAGGWMYRLITDPTEYAATSDGSPREQLLNLLRDGRWHSNEEMYELINVSYQDHLYFLRKEGFVINKMRDPETGVWHYKLEI